MKDWLRRQITRLFDSPWVAHKFAEPSLLDEMLSSSTVITLDGSYTEIPEVLRERLGKGMLDLIVTKAIPPVELQDAYLTADGLIFMGWKPSRLSAFYSYLTLRKLLLGLLGFFRRGRARVIEKASFVSQQVAKKGTFGDFYIEFMPALCANLPEKGSCLVLASNYTTGFAERECGELSLTPCPIPPEGIRVRHLTVLPPAQYFDNFLPRSVSAMQAAYPGRRNAGSFRLIYLSRRGFVHHQGSATLHTGRVFPNELEVEDLLEKHGYRIVHTHDVPDEEVRRLAGNADTVIAPHGAAIFHMMWAPPRRLIEIAHLDWHLPGFLKLAHALGIPKYQVLAAPGGIVPLDELSRILEE